MSDPRQRIEELSAEKRALLELRLKRLRESKQAARFELERRPSTTPPLSFAQERLWFLDQLEAGSAYNDSLALALEGRLDHAALAAGLSSIARRHEILRSRFGAVAEGPVCEVGEAVDGSLPMVDLSRLNAADEAPARRALIGAAVATRFDLAAAPPWRKLLLRRGGERHVLVLVIHHILIDGWSWNVLLRELALEYRAGAESGRAAGLPDPPVQYGDYARWQREVLAAPRLERDLEYWREELAGLPPVLELPLDRPRPAVQSLRGGRVALPIGRRLSQAVRALARDGGATLFMTTLTAAVAVIARWTGERDLALGTPVLGRDRPELEGLIGVFINTIVLRQTITGRPTFRQLLERVRERSLAALERQALPFEKLVEALHPERNLGHSPIFQVLFEVQGTQPALGEVAGLELAPMPLELSTTRFDLSFSLEDDENGLGGSLSYNADLFDRTTIERLARWYVACLEAVSADPGVELERIALSSPAQRAQTLVEWADGGVLPAPGSIAELVAGLRRRGGEIAVRCAERSLTAAEVERRSRAVARGLSASGLAPGDRVGVLLGRGPELVIVLLAALRAGVAYLPLDPAHPDERIRYSLADAEARAVITDAAGGARVAGLDLLQLAPAALEAAGEGVGEAPDPEIDDRHLAYVIYTSGSTGRPKGVEVERAQLFAFLAAVGERVGPAPGETFLAVTTVAFDIAALELFLPLLRGAELVLARETETADARELAGLIAACGATAMQATPATWRLLVHGGWEGRARLRVLCGGEALPADLGSWLATRCAELWNLYGPTETTVWSACARLRPPVAEPVSIGRPLAGTIVRVLDARLLPTLAGSAGEIWIGGAGVARGYRGKPGLTAERFVPDPAGSVPGARLYRTGDLGRWRADGTLELFGRIDFQVKLRGYRIELGEIEAALRELDEVAESVVVLRRSAAGEPQLVAYAVPSGGGRGAPEALLDALRRTLPAYMIPARLSWLDELPRGASGKVDRRALAASDEVDEAPRIEPRTPTERRLAEIFADVLNLERVGAGDDFFRLGGHSLLAARLMLQLREELGVELRLIDLFQHSTLAALASLVDRGASRAGDDEGPRLERVVPDGPLPASFAQQRLWAVEHLEGPNAAYNLPLRLELEGELRPRVLTASLRLLELRHPSLRTRFRPLENGELEQVVLGSPRLRLPVVDLARLPAGVRDATAAELARLDLAVPMSLLGGELVRVRLLRLGARRHQLLSSVHHSIADGWSLGVMARDLGVIYRALDAGRRPELPELALRYADFALWQRRRMDEARLDEHLDFWRSQLAGVTDAELPTDRPRRAQGSLAAGRHRLRLGPAVAMAARRLARRLGVTPFIVLFAGWELLLGRLTAARRLLTGSVVANRPVPELEPVVGYFANTVVDAADLRGRPGFAELVERTHRRWIEASDHHQLPFGLLSDAVQRGAARQGPLFAALFVLQNWPQAASAPGGLAVRASPPPPAEAKFEITMSVAEDGEALLASVEYRASLFDPTTIRRWGEAYVRLLSAATERPDLGIFELPALSAAQTHQLSREWGERRPVPLRPLLLERFAQQVRSRPQACALSSADEAWTYAELDAESNRLGRWLVDHGVVRESLVGICAERSPRLVLAIIAVLKAGAAYVPLDPKAPAARLSWMLENSAVSWVLTDGARADAFARAGQLSLDEPERWSDRSQAPLDIAIDPQQLAYVIYTSGSTGRPKGCQLSHAAAARLLTATERYFDFGTGDVWALFHSCAFDMSVWEIWGALGYGGKLVIVPFWISRSREELYRLLVDERVTVFNVTPSAFRLIVDEDAVAPDALRRQLALRWVTFGGEPFDLSSAKRWSERHSLAEPRLINLYGITETTVHSTYYEVDAETLRGFASSPVGRAFDDLSITLRTRDGRLVPPGSIGEIWVAGEGLARGYLGRPALTAERFVPDPDSPVAGDRAYRSGDLGRQRHDGALGYRGRFDDQLKIRGFRVEIGEIQTTLARHPAVRDAVVVLQQHPSGPRLVGYYVPSTTPPVSVGELRALLEHTLPEYMVPSHLVALDQLPLTVNGKLDRSALPAVDAAPTGSGGSPTTAAELTLARVWSEVLGCDPPGVEDDFFHLGGDSILAIQVVARARRAGLHLVARDLFEAPTIARLARRAREDAASQAERGPLAGPAPLLPIQHDFFSREPLAPHHFNQGLMLSFTRRPRPRRLSLALAVVLAHHDALRLRFEHRSQGWSQRYAAPGGAVPLTVVELSRLSADDRRAALVRQSKGAQGSLDLERGPMLRALLFLADEPEQCRLLLFAHHLVVDGVSWRILLEDLADAYAAGASARDLPPKTSSVRQWGEAFAAWGTSDAADRELARWSAWLARPVAPMPRDLPGPAGANGAVRTASSVEVELGEAETAELLRRLPARLRCSLDHLLTTALVAALAPWVEGGRVRLDVETHGRSDDLFPQLDASRTVGWLTALFPLVVETGGSTWELLRRVKSLHREATAAAQSYGALRAARPQAAQWGRSEIVFNYFGQLDGAIAGSTAFRPAPEPVEGLRHPDQQRSHLLEINGAVQSNRLRYSWSYSREAHHRETIERLAQRFVSMLGELIEGSRRDELARAAWHGSDFPLAAGLDDAALALLLARGELEDVYPLAPLQRGLFAEALLEPSATTNFEQLCLRLRGALDAGAFERAWGKLVERHAALRTAFVSNGLEAPLQAVYRGVDLPWVELDLRHAERPADEIERFLRRDRERGFELERAPLMRVALLRLAEERWMVVWSHHHLLLDGWSLPVLVGELLTLYRAELERSTADLPLPEPYADYVRWVCEQDLGAAEEHFRGLLENVDEPTPLGLDGGRRTGESDVAAVRAELQLGERETRALAVFARQRRLTVNTLVQGAWAILLSRYSGHRTVLYGSVTSGRTAPLAAIDQRVGLFINTLPTRVEVASEARVLPWLRELQRQQLESREYEFCPLDAMRSWSSIGSGRPLFESILAYENYPVDHRFDSLGEHHLEVESARLIERPSYPLSLVADLHDRLRLTLLFDRGRIERAAARRALHHLEGILVELVASPQRRLGEVEVLTPAERQQLEREWPRREPVPVRPLLVERFENWARRRPRATAVSCADVSWSYGELDAEANRLARWLVRRGVGADTLVGICAERSPRLVLAILAVLKAGGAYLPLDPGAPEQRLSWLLEDSAASLVLASRDQLQRFSSGTALCLDERAAWSGESPEPLGLDIDPRQLAYVIYTSGSTGRPKGCQVTHHNVARLLTATEESFAFSPDDVWMLFHSYAFDFSVWELWGALAYGGRLVVVPYWVSRSPEELYRLLARERVSVLNMTPSAFRLLVAEDAAASHELRRALALRWVIFGGEAVDLPSVARWASEHGLDEPRLVNMYGITETTVHVTRHQIDAGDLGAPGNPIGRPIRDLSITLRDPRGRLVPLGVPGEIQVGGDGVCRGYLGRPRLTAERFVPDATATRAGQRVYRSGDLATQRPDGSFDYLGRADQQVKIRGFRIELGEIERALVALPAVAEAVATLREMPADERQIVAYAVLSDDAAEPPELRHQLAASLPDYMIPAHVVTVPSIPLTINGKVDFARLPQPGGSRDAAREAPRSAAENALATIWRELLGVETVGIHDNFFELGGDSIVAIQVVTRARRAGLAMTPRDLFATPTIAELAAASGSATAEGDQGPAQGEAPLTPIQHDFFAQRLADREHFNQALLLAIDAGVGAARLHRACRLLVRHHDALRLRFARPDGEWRQRYAGGSGGTIALTVDLGGLGTSAARDELGRLTARAQRTLDIERGPLFRALHALLPETGGRLLLVAHHLVVDGVSWRVLLEDLTLLLAADGDAHELPARTTAYGRWAELLAAWAGSSAAAADAGYWRSLLAASVASLPAADAPAGTNDATSDLVADEASVEIELAAAPTGELLRRLATASRSRVDELVAAALVAAVGEWARASRLRLVLEAHGRLEELFEEVDLSRTVGWFTALYPLVVDTADGVWGALREVKKGRREAPRAGLSYGVLVQAGELPAEPAGELLFNYLGQLDAALASDGVLRPASEPVGPLRSPRQRRAYALEVNAGVRDGRLALRLAYGGRRYRRSTVEALARRIEELLVGLAGERRATVLQSAWVPADFPLVPIREEGLAALLRRGEVEDLYPLAPLQAGMLFHTLQAPHEAAYFQQLGGRLLGELDLDALRSSWEGMTSRHPELRVSLLWEGASAPLQVAWRRVRPSFFRIDLGAVGIDVERWWSELLAADRARGFELDRAPLMRLLLVRESRTAHRLLWSYHHALFDGWSLPMLLEELLGGYSAAVAGEQARPTSRRPFRDYVRWLAKQDHAAAEEFWRATLAGFTEPTRLPLPAPRDVDPEAESEALIAVLPASLTQRLEGTARRLRLTLNTLFQGAWALLLSRLGAGTDLVVGSVTSGRPAELDDVDRMIGPFINTVPLRLSIPAADRLDAWLEDVQRRQVEARAYELSPLFEVQQWSDVEPGTALFEALFVYENYPVSPSLRTQRGEVELLDVELLERTNYPLTLFVADPAASREPERSRAVELRLGYAPGRFARIDMMRLLDQLGALLEAMAEDPCRSLASLSPLRRSEAHQLLAEWNDTRQTPRFTEPVDRLLADRARRHPDRPAVRCAGRELSYGELEARVEALAARLRASGVRPEVLVGVCVERSLEAVVSFLAVWAAGGAYLPIDPAFPRERLSFMLDDAAAGLPMPVILTQAALAPTLGERSEKLLLVDELESLPPASRAAAAGGARELDALAYVLYTSGSTGRPKGIQITHRALLNFLSSMSRRPGLAEGESWVAVTSFSFDISGLELFLPLAVGGRVVLADGAESADGARLARLIEHHAAATMQATPVTWELLLAAGWRSPAGFRALSGGEALAGSLAQRLLAAGAEVWNLYGPTETTIWSTVHAVGDADDATVPIGRPLANTQVHVVGAGGALAPIGAPGELLIGGLGLARGYLGRPALTAERFVPDAFGGRGERLYRTGDLVRRRADGVLEFLGRLDHQVKVRGLRIELGEIEATLERHAAVERAVVTVITEKAGDSRLVAYVQAVAEQPGSSELREWAAGYLPEYMLPSFFVPIREWPLTPNRKIDRRALPSPRAAAAPAARYRPPQSELERSLALIWAQVLGVERVGLGDSFFELGGHSLLLLTVHGRLRDEVGVEISVPELFQFRRLGDLAQHLAQRQALSEDREKEHRTRIAQRRQGKDRLRQRRLKRRTES